MTYRPLDESSQHRRAIVYGRANQASAHYRPLRKGRPTPAPAAAPSGPAAKASLRRRLVLFVVAVLVAVAFGTTIFGVVLANPTPMGQAPLGPAREAPEPAVQPPPSIGHGAPVELAPPSIGKSGSPLETTVPPPTSASTPAAGGDAVAPAAPATSASLYFQNCNKVRRAGAAPLYPGDPGYSPRLDKDGNGVACDEKEGKRANRG